MAGLSPPRREVPNVPLRVTGRVFALAVRLVGRRRFNRDPRLPSALKVSIDVVDKHDETARLSQKGSYLAPDPVEFRGRPRLAPHVGPQDETKVDNADLRACPTPGKTGRLGSKRTEPDSWQRRF